MQHDVPLIDSRAQPASHVNGASLATAPIIEQPSVEQPVVDQPVAEQPIVEPLKSEEQQ